MLRCASVYTYEIDDPVVALNEIKAQLFEKITLQKHSAGIVMCHPEFIKSGVLKCISEGLPFDLVGATTASQAVNDTAGGLALTIFVMTSDDVFFRTGVTESIGSDIDGPAKTAYERAGAGLSEAPGLAVVFLPLILEHAGDAYIEAWKKIIPKTPVFGTVAADETLTFEESETIYNGKSYKTAMPFVLCYGNIQPRFLVGTFPLDKAMPYKGEITKSNGPFVSEINNINAYKYFEEIGFINNGALVEAFLLVPFVIDQKKREDYDGVPVVRGHASFTEDGTAIFRGYVDEGSTFTLLTYDPDDILKTTRRIMEQINELPGKNGVLLFPCIVRRMITQRIGHTAELDAIRNTIAPDVPFMGGYAGGEVCPTSVRDEAPTNRFHNFSLVALVV